MKLSEEILRAMRYEPFGFGCQKVMKDWAERIAALEAELEKVWAENEMLKEEQNQAELAIGGWLAAALNDPEVCAEMKLDITRWFTYLDGRKKKG